MTRPNTMHPDLKEPEMSQTHAKPMTDARRRRVGIVSLGCAKNLVDAEIMLG